MNFIRHIRRQKDRSGNLLWVLAVLLVLQSVILPVVTQPYWLKGQNGQWVVLCTLQGLQSVYVAHDGDKQTPSGATHNHCPACILSGNYNVPVSSIFDTWQPEWIDNQQEGTRQTGEIVSISALSHCAIRAPPAA
jgi:hypothetical protein